MKTPIENHCDCRTGFDLSSLPDGVTDEGLDFQHENLLYGYLSRPLIEDLTDFFKGRRVLEVYAGRGHLSSALQQNGIQIKATSLQSGHDGSYYLGHVIPVERIDAVSAVQKYVDWMDVLLVSWPTTDDGLERCLKYLPDGCHIVFIGEVTDYTVKPPFLGGCATDNFFAQVVEIKELSALIRYPTPRRDTLKVYKKR